MRQRTRVRREVPGSSATSSTESAAVLPLDESRSVLDEVVCLGASKMLQQALEGEVESFLERHAARRDAHSNRLVVRNGHLPERTILTGAGPIKVRQPRVRDNGQEEEQRVRFSSSILPPYLRRSKAIDELLPWLYLKGVSTGDFTEALQALLGPGPRA